MEKLLKNKVMIVDDDKTVILPIEMSLQEKGIETISFNDGESAIEYLKNNKVSAILLDYHMEPHINGDEVIKRIREFDKETIIYLQTAYSEELPAIDMLEKYEIQGYIDKGKRAEDRLQLIMSALKQAQLIELVKEQQKEIEAHTYKEEFLGKFLDLLMGEIKEKSFSVVGNIEAISDFADDIDNNEDFKKYVENVKKAIKDLNELIESLDIEEKYMTIGNLRNTLERLFNIMCSMKKIKLNINIEDENKLLKGNAKTVIYMITDIIEYLVNRNDEEINIKLIVENDKNIAVIENKIEDKELINKLSKLAMFDENITIVDSLKIEF